MTRRKKLDQLEDFIRETSQLEELLSVPVPVLPPGQEAKEARETRETRESVPVPVETSNRAFMEAWQEEWPSLEGTERTGAELLVILLEHGPLTRKELVIITGLPRSTVYDALTRLEKRGQVSRGPEPVPEGAKRRHGRPKVLWRVKQPDRSEQPLQEGDQP